MMKIIQHFMRCSLLILGLAALPSVQAAPKKSSDELGKLLQQKKQQQKKTQAKPDTAKPQASKKPAVKTEKAGAQTAKKADKKAEKPADKKAEKKAEKPSVKKAETAKAQTAKKTPAKPEQAKPQQAKPQAAKPQQAKPVQPPIAAPVQAPQRQEKDDNDTPDHAALDALIRQKSVATPKAKPVEAPPVAKAEKSEKAEKKETASRGGADDLISSAMGFIGVAYRFGGTSPTGFDCSGFMQYVFRKAYAVNLPRTSAAQASVGVPVSRSELQPGDMVFFRTMGGGRISHVGMYVGNDRFIHAPRTGKRIEITSLSSKYWSSKYATARRVKRQNAQNFIRS